MTEKCSVYRCPNDAVGLFPPFGLLCEDDVNRIFKLFLEDPKRAAYLTRWLERLQSAAETMVGARD